MKTKIALIGNPNCGKTTLFNTLTGLHQKVGNWSGVTTEQKKGKYVKDSEIEIVDLPGLYSLDTRSEDENAVINYVKNEKPNVIINVLDGTKLERSLYLTTEIIKLKIPIVLAINYVDELEKNNINLDTSSLENLLHLPVVKISALKGKNVEKLILVAKNNTSPPIERVIKTCSALKSYVEREEFIRRSLKCVLNKQILLSERVTQKVDKVLLGRFSGPLIFILVMFLLYFISIKVGGCLGSFFSNGFNNFSDFVKNYFVNLRLPEWIISLTCSAILKGIGSVLSFLPQLLILYTLLTVLEHIGYSARTAFLTDRIFRVCGLGGKSFIPMMLGCGCTVNGLMATRTIEDTNERIMTVFLTPFIPCGAKTAVFGWFASKFFGGSALLATFMYFLGIVCACVFGRVLKRLVGKSKEQVFLLEIPSLRFPRAKDVIIVLVEKVKEFLTKAGLIVFVVSVMLWALCNLGISGYTNGVVEKSFIYAIGDILKYVFYPLGFGNWQSAIAVISGFFAKEAVVETLGLLSTNLSELFPTVYSVYSFSAFILLSPPCIASLAQAKTELSSRKKLLLMMLFQFLVGYTVALFINVLGILVENGLLLSIIVGIIITLLTITAFRKIKKPTCAGCKVGKCNGEENCKAVKRYTT